MILYNTLNIRNSTCENESVLKSITTFDGFCDLFLKIYFVYITFILKINSIHVLPIIYACTATFIINLPFGYLRGGFKKLSLLWFLMIHLPVPFVIVIRRFEHLHLTLGLAPFLLGSFFLGQFVGRKIYQIKPWRKNNINSPD